MKHSRSLLGSPVPVPPALAGCGAVDLTIGTTACGSASGQTLPVPAATRDAPGEMHEGVKNRTELPGKNLGYIITIQGDDERAAKTDLLGTANGPGLDKPMEFGALRSTALQLIKNRNNSCCFRSASASPLKRWRGRVSVERSLAGKEICDGIRTGFCR